MHCGCLSLNKGQNTMNTDHLVNSGLMFAIKHLCEFNRYREYLNENDEDLVRGEDKIIAETALLVLLLSRNPTKNHEKAHLLRRIISIVTTFACSERNKSLILRLPQLSASLGIPYIVLSRLGIKDAELDGIIANSLFSDTVNAIERVPFRDMDLRWIRYVYTEDTTYLEETENFLDNSILGGKATALHMQREDFYALTHCIMYLSDFGSKTISGLDVNSMEILITECIKVNLLEMDFDLIAELLLCLSYVSDDLTYASELSLQFSVSAWSKLGFLPSRSFDPETFKGLKGSEKAAYSFSTIYHTLYVSLLMIDKLNENYGLKSFSVSDNFEDEIRKRAISVFIDLSSNKTRSKKSKCVNHSHCPYSLEQMAARFVLKNKGEERKIEWLKYMIENDTLDQIHQMKLLLDLSLISAIKRYDLDEIVDLIVFAKTLNLGSSSFTVRAAISFLLDQQLNTGFIGAHFVVEENKNSTHSEEFHNKVAYCLDYYFSITSQA